MKTNDKIRTRRQALGLTLEEVANAVGVAKSTVKKWESGQIASMRQSKIAALASVLRVNPMWLVMDDPETPMQEGHKVGQTFRIPVLGNVAAGIPLEAIQDVYEFEEISQEMAARGKYVGLRIHGDSMAPELAEGDVVIVRLTETAETGDMAVVFINGNDATCKILKKASNGIFLISINPKYEPMFFSVEEVEQLPVTVFGVVEEARRKYSRKSWLKTW